MGDSRTLFGSSKFLWARERISSNFIGNLGARPQTSWSALAYTILDVE